MNSFTFNLKLCVFKHFIVLLVAIHVHCNEIVDRHLSRTSKQHVEEYANEHDGVAWFKNEELR